MSLPAGPTTAATHTQPKKPDPQTGGLPMCDAETVATPVTSGEYAMISQEPVTRAIRVSVVAAAPGSGRTAIHTTFINAALPGGTSTQVVYTAPAGRLARILSVIARYNGANAGSATAQLHAGPGVPAVRAEAAAASLISGTGSNPRADVNLLDGGREILLNATESIAVVLTGATGGDTLEVHVQGEELTV